MISGLKLIHNWLDVDERRHLEIAVSKALSLVRSRRRTDDRSRVLRFGWTYATGEETPRRLSSWPDWLEELRLRLPHVPSIEGCAITLNEYAPGHKILPHLDTLAVKESIQSISLGCNAWMRFTRLPGSSDPPCIHEFELGPGTLCILIGQARYHWQHEILPVPALRYSVVFREYPLTAPPAMTTTTSSEEAVL